MLKIINVISDTNIGGAGNLLLNFLELTNTREFDNYVIIPTNSLLKERLNKLNIKYKEIDGINDKSLNQKSIKDFIYIFKEIKPDVVHTHAVMSARIAARIYGKCKIVHTRHSVFDQTKANKSFPLKQIKGTINNYLSDIIIAVSPAAKENVVETGTNPNKVKVIFNGVKPVKPLNPSEKLEIRNKYNLSETDFVCIIIARLEEVKGHKYILEAAKMLESLGDIKIIIAGTGAIENDLRELAKNMELTNCIFTGFIKEIHELENIMDLQLNASFGTEATSLSLLEGMSLGIPAVVSDFGGNPYVIENGVNGLVVPKKDSKAIYNGILKMYNDKDLYKFMSENSEKIFKEKFTLNQMVTNIENVYKSFYSKK